MNSSASTIQNSSPSLSKTTSSSPITSTSSPSLSPGSGATTDTSVTTNEDYEHGSFQHLNDQDIPRAKLEPSSGLSRPSLEGRTNSFYKRHSSFDTPREIPLPSGRLLNESNLSDFPFTTDPFTEADSASDDPTTPSVFSGYAKRPQLFSRKSSPNPSSLNLSQRDPRSAPPIPILAHRSSRSDPPNFERKSSSSTSLPLPSLQSVHTLPQIDTSPETLSRNLLSVRPALSNIPSSESEASMIYSSSKVPPPPPSPPLPVRELSPPPSRRTGALARSRTNRLNQASGQSPPITPPLPSPLPSPPLLASPTDSDGSAFSTPNSPRSPGPQTYRNVTFGSALPTGAPTLSSPRSPKKPSLHARKSSKNIVPSSENKSQTSPPISKRQDPLSNMGNLAPYLPQKFPTAKPSNALSGSNIHPSYFSHLTPGDTRITSMPPTLSGSSGSGSGSISFSNPSTPSNFLSTAHNSLSASTYRTSMPRFSIDAQGGYAKNTINNNNNINKLPRTPSLAQAPPEVRKRMLLGSTRARMGERAAPPSPPTILDPIPSSSSDTRPDVSNSPSQVQAHHSIGAASSDFKPPTTTTFTPMPSSSTLFPSLASKQQQQQHNNNNKPLDRTPSQKAHERFLAKAGLPPTTESSTGYIAVSTHPTHYEIIIRLEGVSLDSITLSTRKRRVLHLAADIYGDGDAGAGGGGSHGHWERRISFGWDADLSSVRAEFDGRFLKVTVPRKLDDV